MTILLTLSLMLNAALAVALAFFVWLTRQQARVVRTLPVAAVKDAPVAVQAAVGVAETVSGLTAEEEREAKLAEDQRRWEAEEGLRDLGIDPRELERLTSL